MRRRSWVETNALMLPILLLAFLLRMWGLDTQSLWWDEAIAFVRSAVDLPSLMHNFVNHRVLTPLYFLLLHFWLNIGRSEFLMRSLSAFLGVLTVGAMFPVARLAGGRRLGVVASFLLAISPLHIWYSQETRMYALATFLVLMSTYFLIQLLRRDSLGNWLGYGAFSLLALYNHTLSGFVLLAHMTFLTLVRARHRVLVGKWLLCAAVVGVLFAPWPLALFPGGGFRQAPIGWIPPAEPADLFWTAYNFAVGSPSDIDHPLNLAAALVVVVVLGWASIRLFRSGAQEKGDGLRLIWLWLVLPTMLIFLISLDLPLPDKRSVYMDRYLITQLPAFLILLGYGLVQLWDRSKTAALVVGLGLLLTISASVYSLYFDPVHYRDQWREAIAQIRENAQDGDLLLVRPHHYVPLYYYEVPEIPQHTVPYLESSQEYEAFLDREISTSLNQGGRIWTMIVSENANPHRFTKGTRENLWAKVERDEIRAWLLENMQLLEELELRGIYLALYGQS